MNNDSFNNPFDQDDSKDLPSTIDQSGMSPLEDDTGNRRLVWILSGIILLGCGCLFVLAFFYFQPDTQSVYARLFPTSTATFTQTPSPTPTPNTTATQQAIQATATQQAMQTTIADARNNWDILLADKFTSNQNNWATGNDDDSYAKIARTVGDGIYQWDATAKKGFVSWVSADTEPVEDFYLSMEARRSSGSSSSDYGMIFREDRNNNFYYFGIDNDSFHVSLNYDNDWIDVVNWTTSGAIQPNEPNRLTVIAKGSRFIFLINNQVVAEATDDHIPRGTTGLAIQLFDADLQATFQFTAFELRVPASPPTLTSTPNLTATSISNDWPIILADTFDSNKNNWETLSSEDSSAKTTLQVSDGKYQWDIESHQLAINWATANSKSLTDFVMSVDIKQVSGPQDADYGVFFRENTNVYGYYFGINNDGKYILQLYNGKWIDLIDYTKSDLIQPGEVNRITIIAEGSHFSFYINGYYLNEITDDRLKTGRVGLTTTLHDGNQHAVFEFDNFELHTP